MGYILPIQQHEYTDYQKRISKVRKNRYEIEKPSKVILESQYEEVDQAAVSSQQSQLKENQQVDTAYIELTGNGKFINKLV